MKSLRSEFISELSGIYTTSECAVLWRRALSHVCSIDYSRTYFVEEGELRTEQKEELRKILKRLAKNEPIEYITGTAEFCSLKFRVDKSVLIPRLETQEMVDFIKRNHSSDQTMEIADIGTGSGCIAVALALYFPNSKITAIDISADALDVARSNAALNSAGNIEFLQADFLHDDCLKDRKFDLIVSNPPYVRHSEIASIPSRVLNFEPHTALFVNDSDPLIFYKRIAAMAPKLLNENGTVMVEANQWLCKETESVFKRMSFDTKIIKDLFSQDRFVVARLFF